MANIWDDVLTERDKQVFQSAGWGRPGGFGNRPVILVIDVNYNFVGDKPEPILESVKRWRYSCGEEGWAGVFAIKELLEAARPKKIPVIYTTQGKRPDGFDNGAWNRKSFRAFEEVDVEGHFGNEIVKEISPRNEDILMVKKKPSAFFGTPLVSYLVDLKADTVILTGTTTSGCIRATAIDSFSYNYYTIIPQECVWDRGQTSHKINLFDIHMKYGDVVLLKDVISYLASLPENLYENCLLFTGMKG